MAANNDAAENEKRDKSSSGPDDSRRSFLRTGLALALVLVAAGVASVTKSLWNPATAQGGQTTTSTYPKVKVANVSDLLVNIPLTFNYPLDDEPNLIAKTGVAADGGVGPDGDIVAFSQVCQHLGCIYGYVAPGKSPPCKASFKAGGPVGYCCCHGSVYDLTHGARVLGGPAPNPQPQVVLEYDAATGNIYATGMKGPTIFGHSDDLSGGTLVS